MTMFSLLLSFFTISLVNVQSLGVSVPAPETLIASRTMSLTNRYHVASVNTVMRDNIMLTLAYMSQQVPTSKQIDWDQIHTPASYTFTLRPGETFAFHDDTTAGYTVSVTTLSHFISQEGFKSDGYMAGDGVCHLASLMNWVARDAGLSVNAPSNHNFRDIPDIDKTYGTSIYYYPGRKEANAKKNLYITNTKTVPVRFDISWNSERVTIDVVAADLVPSLHARS